MSDFGLHFCVCYVGRCQFEIHQKSLWCLLFFNHQIFPLYFPCCVFLVCVYIYILWVKSILLKYKRHWIEIEMKRTKKNVGVVKGKVKMMMMMGKNFLTHVFTWISNCPILWFEYLYIPIPTYTTLGTPYSPHPA